MRSFFPTVLASVGLSFALFTACQDDDTDSKPGTSDTAPPVDTQDDGTDADGDGWTEADGDCDDSDPDVHQGVDEECNGIDDNCNGLVDEGYDDTDDDGTADCVDTEECDGVDNDGDGEVDEDFADDDGDGVADCMGTEECDGVDNDDDGEVDEGYDADGDGYTQCGSDTMEADCNDEDSTIYPDAIEVAGDLTDNDCDGLVDEGEWAAGDLVITELMNNPAAVSDAHGEWFEVYNASERQVFLNGIVIASTTDSDYHQVDSDDLLSLEAGAAFVLGLDDDTAANGDVDVDYVYEDIILSNETDDIYLMAGSVVLDEVSWDDGDTMPDPSGASINLDPWSYDATSNDDPDPWCASTEQWGIGSDMGSPGEENELCSTWDHDGDGYSGDDGDCDDTDDTIYPGAPEEDPDVDNDCDGDVEAMPTADIAYDEDLSTLYTCDRLYLLGSDSFDPDGASLTYTWELVTAPSGSALTTDDIDDATDADPVFIPDVAGTYEFSLVVNDGGADSYPETLSVDIDDRPYNDAPIADAGADQTGSGSASCSAVSYEGEVYTCDDCDDYDFTLDATGSADADDDELTYSWSVISGSGSLDDSTSGTPTLTVTGPSATYGETTDETVEVSVTVTDCMGESSTDIVEVTYSCTGS